MSSISIKVYHHIYFNLFRQTSHLFQKEKKREEIINTPGQRDPCTSGDLAIKIMKRSRKKFRTSTLNID